MNYSSKNRNPNVSMANFAKPICKDQWARLVLHPPWADQVAHEGQVNAWIAAQGYQGNHKYGQMQFKKSLVLLS